MSEPQMSEQPSLAATIGRVAGIICSDGLSTGDRTKLRRMVPGQPLPLVFIQFALAHLPEYWEVARNDWVDAAQLLVTRDEAKRDRLHYRIVKDYFSNLESESSTA